MSTNATRNAFVAHFGEDLAARIEAAAERHVEDNDVPAPTAATGTEERFIWSIVITIGWECVTRFYRSHGLDALDPEEFAAWTRANVVFGDTPQRFDPLAVADGAFESFVRR